MSENLERLRRGYELYAQGDYDGLVELVADDLVIERPGAQAPVEGKQAFRAFLEPDAFEMQTMEPLEFVENGACIYVKVHSRLRGAGSGVEWAQDVFHVFTMRDGVAVTLFATQQEDEARREAGLGNVPRP